MEKIKSIKQEFTIWAMMSVYLLQFIDYLPVWLDFILPAVLITLFYYLANNERGNFRLKFSRWDFLIAIGLIVASSIVLYWLRDVAFEYRIRNEINILYLLGFVIFNGFREEILFRFALIRLNQNKIMTFLSIFITSVFFGYAHYKIGMPSGIIGSILTFIFSILISLLYVKSKSFGLVWLTHSVMDAVIIYIVMKM